MPDANHIGYGAGVLANVGTTLLLVGIVVLLERRRLRRADPRPRGADPHELGSVDAEAEARRMADEYSRRVVDAESGDAERDLTETGPAPA